MRVPLMLVVARSVTHRCTAGYALVLSASRPLLTDKSQGRQEHGRLGDNVTTDTVVAYPPAVPAIGLSSGVTHVSCAHETFCAIVSGEARCAGLGFAQGLGTGSSDDEAIAKAVVGMTSGVTSVVAGLYYGCAIKDRVLYCWGINLDGQLGSAPSSKIVRYPTAVGAAAVLPRWSYDHTCWWARSGTTTCSGSNQLFKVGAPPPADFKSATAPHVIGNAPPRVDTIAAGYRFTCFLGAYSVSCMGDPGDSGTGQNMTAMAGLDDGVEFISGGGTMMCGIFSNGTYWCMGGSLNTQLGHSGAEDAPHTLTGVDQCVGLTSTVITTTTTVTPTTTTVTSTTAPPTAATTTVPPPPTTTAGATPPPSPAPVLPPTVPAPSLSPVLAPVGAPPSSAPVLAPTTIASTSTSATTLHVLFSPIGDTATTTTITVDTADRSGGGDSGTSIALFAAVGAAAVIACLAVACACIFVRRDRRRMRNVMATRLHPAAAGWRTKSNSRSGSKRSLSRKASTQSPHRRQQLTSNHPPARSPPPLESPRRPTPRAQGEYGAFPTLHSSTGGGGGEKTMSTTTSSGKKHSSGDDTAYTPMPEDNYGSSSRLLRQTAGNATYELIAPRGAGGHEYEEIDDKVVYGAILPTREPTPKYNLVGITFKQSSEYEEPVDIGRDGSSTSARKTPTYGGIGQQQRESVYEEPDLDDDGRDVSGSSREYADLARVRASQIDVVGHEYEKTNDLGVSGNYGDVGEAVRAADEYQTLDVIPPAPDYHNIGDVVPPPNYSTMGEALMEQEGKEKHYSTMTELLPPEDEK